MDITAFFPEEDISDNEVQSNEYKKNLFKLANRGCINTLQYSYFQNYIKISGTVCNLKGFIEQINGLKEIRNVNKMENNNENSDKYIELIKEFRSNLAQALNKFFKYDEENDIMRINKNIKYYMTRSDSIDFTKEQKNALQSMYEFLIDNNKNTFGLYGFAGSGKTTTVVEFVSYMMRNKYLNKVVFAAPTNKALNVIKTKFKVHIKKIIETLFDKKLEDTFNFDDELEFLEQKQIIIKFLTIHKLLMFKTDYSVSGDMIFIRDAKNGSVIPDFELVIIDECSMISMDMIDNIFEEIRIITNINNRISKDCCKQMPKIIFTGDPAQLPPVNEEDSSIFCKTTIELPFEAYLEAMKYKISNTVSSNIASILDNKYKILLKDLSIMETVLLTNVVRSKIDNVTKVCYELRKWIKDNEEPKLDKFNDSKGVYFYNNNQIRNKIQSDWFKKFLTSVKEDKSCIIITWTNKQTDIYNETIRQFIFKGKKIQKFEQHDILMLSDFYGLDMGETFVKQKLYTSEQIKVISTKKMQVPINQFDTIINNSIKKMKQGIKIENKIKELITGLNELFCKEIKFMCWILKVHKFGEELSHNMTLIIIDDIDIERYTKYKSESCIVIKNFAKQMMAQYRTCPKQIEKNIIKPLWKQWNKIFVEPFANVNYGYSITCHKAQGSSFYDVFVDLDDILLNSRSNEAKKCAYTACTRPSNELHILI